MLRSCLSITALAAVACTLLACSGPNPEPATTTVQASTSAQCFGGGGPPPTVTVTLTYFDARSLELDYVQDGEDQVAWLTPDTTLVAADLSEWPPEPIIPACPAVAQAYDAQLRGGLVTRQTVQRIAQLASHGCDATIAVLGDGTIESFQPAP
jgi:hypothetical protein